jgi:hypothetical protein
VVFDRVVATAYHPTYVTQFQSGQKRPVLFRSVEVPGLRPQPWRAALDSGRLDYGGMDAERPLSVMDARDHLHVFAETWLPFVDAAGYEIDPEAVVPILRELEAWVQSAPERRYPDDIERQRRERPEYAARLARTEEEVRSDATRLLAEIEALLSVPAATRVRLAALRAHWRWAADLYAHVMTEDDRARLLAFASEFGSTPLGRREAREARWQSAETGIAWSVRAGSRYRLRVEGEEELRLCVRALLAIDLSPLVPVALPRRAETDDEIRARFA